ncbi:MAG TPA: efflux RND transporter periplasmic adaptor subunit [Gemmatimonadales bacterium]|nr:efflux RND transporter periplasmic adaptor subunit [Gemmatimonadales bacterium]
MTRRSSVVLGLTLLVGGCGRPPADRLIGTGTLEVIEVDVSPTGAARAMRLWVDEGDTVHAGDTLVTLTQPTSGPEVAQRRAALNAAQAALRELESGARRREIDRAEADVAAAAAERDRAVRDYARAQPLGAAGVISRQQLDAARAASQQAEARHRSAVEALQLLREGTRAERIQAARAEVASARAALAAAEALAAELVLTAPVDGVVLSRNVEPGEMLAGGQSALTLGDVARPWTRVYLSSLVIPRVRVGQAALARLDGLPGREFRGRVVAVSDRAEYTPRIALTEEERADLLFGVKVAFEDSTGLLKPGLPVTVAILAPEPAS